MECGLTDKGHRVSDSGDENILKLNCIYNSVNIIKSCFHTFKKVNFIVCKLYFNKAVINLIKIQKQN